MTIRLLDCVVDLERRSVRQSGTSYRLSPTECRLLAYLFANSSRVVSHQELLREVWGYNPSVRSRTVTSTVHRVRAKIERDPKRPRHLLTAYGAGYRFELLDPMPTGVERPSHALPGEARTLIGRADLLEKLHHSYSDASVVVLHGTGGIGKTSLALAYAYQYLESWSPGGVWWCDLSECVTVDGCIAQLASCLHAGPGVQESDPTSSMGMVLEARGPALIIGDGVEGLTDLLPELMRRWEEQAPSMRWLFTSRVLPSIDAACVLTVPPLDLSDASNLIVTRANALLPRWGDAADPAVQELARILDGLPLAIELAAARAPLMSPTELTERVARGSSVLRDPRRPPRQASLTEAVGWTAALLNAVEASALNQCAAFVGSFSMEAAEAVLRLPCKSTSVADAVESLWRHSLLSTSRGPRGVRLQLLDTVRAFARNVGPDPMAELRAAEHYARLGDGLLIEELQPLQDDLSNIRAGFDVAIRADRIALAVRLAWAEAHVVWTCGPAERLAELLDVLGGHFDQLDSDGQCRYCLMRAWLTLGDEAQRWGEQAVRKATPGSALWAIAQCRLAETAKAASPDERIGWMRDAVQALRQIAVPRLLARGLDAQGRQLVLRGQVDKGIALLREATELRRIHGPEVSWAVTRGFLACALGHDGQSEAAATMLHDSRIILERAQAHMQLARLASIRGGLAWQRGRHDIAVDAFAEALAVQRHVGSRERVARFSADHAASLHNCNRLAEAEAAYQEVLHQVDAHGIVEYQGLVRLNLGVVRLHRGRLRGAEPLLCDARGRLAALGVPTYVAIADGNLGSLYWAEGRFEEAEPRLREASQTLADTFTGVYFTVLLACLLSIVESADCASDCLETLQNRTEPALLQSVQSPLAVASAMIEVMGRTPRRARASALRRLTDLPTPDVFSTFLKRLCVRSVPKERS
ncbi:MAG: winged helix-turn-helix domain-containing protein [Myxococcota bacterium]